MRGKSSATRAELNRHIRTAVERFDLSERDETTWAFMCECGADGCQEWVTLTVEGYEVLLRADEPILTSAHTFGGGRAKRIRGDGQR
jgi:hypothetical protein